MGDGSVWDTVLGCVGLCEVWLWLGVDSLWKAPDVGDIFEGLL